MRISLVKIGNSQDIRLPKAIVEQAGLTAQLELEVSRGAITIRAARRPRQDWEQAAIACGEAGADRLDDWDATVSDFPGEWR